jgi:hypothetical protein
MEMTPELSNLIGMAFLMGVVFAVVGGWIVNAVLDLALALIARRRRSEDAA